MQIGDMQAIVDRLDPNAIHYEALIYGMQVRAMCS